MPTKKLHPSSESRRKNARVYVLLDRHLRDQLKIVAAGRGMHFIDLLGAMAEREIKAWEKLKGITVSNLQAAGERLTQLEAKAAAAPPKSK